MLSSGFANTPVTRSLAYGIVASSILASVTDCKPYFYIQISPHIWEYHQLWRVFAYQLCYTNSTEVLFAALSLYNMRVIERLWGSRKFASFILLTTLLTSILPPLILTLFLRPLTLNTLNYLPAGCTPLLFTLLSQYHATIPQIYKYRLSTTLTPPHSSPTTHPAPSTYLTLSDKSYTYLPALQLAFSQFPGSMIGALTGWIIGYVWRNDILPDRIMKWRVPGWMVGIQTTKREGFEGLRARLEGEGGRATGSGIGSENQEGETRRRTLGRQVLDQFTGAV